MFVIVIFGLHIEKEEPMWNDSGIFSVRRKLLLHQCFRPPLSHTPSVGAKGILWKLNNRSPSRTDPPSSFGRELNSLSILSRDCEHLQPIPIYVCTYTSMCILPATGNWQARYLLPSFLTCFCVGKTKKYFSSKSCDRSMEIFFSHVIRILSTSMSSHFPVNFSMMLIKKIYIFLNKS